MLINTLGVLRDRKYLIYQKPYQLNIVATRSRFLNSNAFDDKLEVFYRDRVGNWVYRQFPCTTDPGAFWLNNPMHPQGTAFLKSGQYVNAYGMGYHKGIYEALVQLRPVTVVRNYNRSGLFKWTINGFEDTGNFGINIHRSVETGTKKVVDNSSAGCLVFANGSDYNLFIKLCKAHRRLYGNRFTVTLIDHRDRRRRALSLTAWTLAIASSSYALGKLIAINEDI